MSRFAVVFTNGRPWTETDYMAMDETADQIELVDGALLVSHRADAGQALVRIPLLMALKPAARAVGLYAFNRLNIRLGPDRIANPDFVVLGDHDRLATVIDATSVALVGEIVSATTAVFDRGLKAQLYAEAKIGWYLLVEPDLDDYESVTLRLLRLDGDHYVEHATAGHGETLKTDQPFPFEIRTADLLEP